MTGLLYILIWRRASNLPMPPALKRSVRLLFFCILQYLFVQSLHQIAGGIEALQSNAVTWRLNISTRILINVSSLAEYIGLSQLVKVSTGRRETPEDSSALDNEASLFIRDASLREESYKINS